MTQQLDIYLKELCTLDSAPTEYFDIAYYFLYNKIMSVTDCPEFIRNLGTEFERIPPGSDITPGSHIDNICAESLRPRSAFEGSEPKLPEGKFGLFTSFPDLLPENASELIARSSGIFVRGEFIALRGINQAVVGLPFDADTTDRIDSIIQNVASAGTNIIYLRPMDYNPDEYSFLANDGKFPGLRGSGRLLADEKLLANQLAVAQRFQDLGMSVRLILPNTLNPEEQGDIQDFFRVELDPDQIGINPDSVEHIENISEYPDVDFIVPGAADLVADILGITRGEYDSTAPNVVVAKEEAIALVRAMLSSYGKPVDIIAAKYHVGKLEPATDEQRVINFFMPRQLFSAQTI